VAEARALVDRLHVESAVKGYIVRLVQATREPARVVPSIGGELAPLIEFGASPRASIALLLASRAHAFLQGQAYVTPADVKAVALDVLRHRVLASYEAQAEDIDSERIIARILDTLPIT
jgi:MoxR-like ATPase